MTVRTEAVDGPRVRLTGRAALLLVVVTMLAVLSVVPVRQYLAQRSHIANLERRATDLEGANEGLRRDIDRLNDPEYLERLARACLGMVKPGEVAFVTRSKPGDRPAGC